MREHVRVKASDRARRIRRRRQVAALLGVAGALLVAYLLSAGSPQARSTAPARQRARARAGNPSAATSSAAVAATLPYTSYIAAGSMRVREVALTFDDGPSPYPQTILRILRRERAQATFFETGRAIRAYPQISRAVLAAGMAVGNHTQSHAFLGRLAVSAQAAEIDGVGSALRAAGLPSTNIFRPPYGSFNAATLSLLRQRQMLTVLWSADTKDFSQPGVKHIIYVAVSAAKPGAIILMHDGGGPRAQTVAALPRIILRLRQRGFRLVSIPQLLRDDPPPRGQRPPRNLAGN